MNTEKLIKGAIYEVGDILDWGDCGEKKVDVIGHQVNCLGVTGGGLAYQIAKKWPDAEDNYKKFIKDFIFFGNPRKNLLGVCQLTTVGGLWIANLFGQFNVGGGIQTDYDALLKALNDLKDKMLYINLTKLALPVNLGCGLAGGDWNIVHSLIKRVFEGEKAIQLTLVEYSKPKT